jgi:hypothetical protein
MCERPNVTIETVISIDTGQRFGIWTSTAKVLNGTLTMSSWPHLIEQGRIMTRKLMMMMVGFGLVYVCAAPTAKSQPGQRPVRTFPLNVNYAALPASLEELAQLSDAVIVGSVSGHRTKQMHTPGASETSVNTDYTLTISEIIKSHPQLPTVGEGVLVERRGGEVNEVDYLRKDVEVGFPPFERGTKYLLFLRLNPVTYAFEVRSGPHGSYAIANGVIDSLGDSELAAKYDGKPADAVLEKLRSAMLR